MNQTKVAKFTAIPVLIGLAWFVVRSGYLERWAGFRTGWTPILECPELIEFGECERGSTIVQRFKIANRGKDPLVIGDISMTCGCLGLLEEVNGRLVRLDKIELRANEEHDVAIQLVVKGQSGKPMEQTILMQTTDPTKAEFGIQTVVSAVKGGSIVVPDIVFVGKVPARQEWRRKIEVYDDRVPPRRLVSVSSTNSSQFSTRLLAEPSRNGAATENSLTLIGAAEIVGTPEVARQLYGAIEIKLTDHDRPNIIPVVGEVHDAITIAPAAVSLPRFSGKGKVYFADCLCVTSEEQPLSVRATGLPPDFTVRIEPLDGQPSAANIHIEWQPTAKPITTHEVYTAINLIAEVGARETPVQMPIICCRGDD